jgi:hypothetical protein
MAGKNFSFAGGGPSVQQREVLAVHKTLGNAHLEARFTQHLSVYSQALNCGQQRHPMCNEKVTWRLPISWNSAFTDQERSPKT